MQNLPNPWSKSTQITYYLKQDVKDAYLEIYATNGSLVKRIAVTSRGHGSVTLDEKSFAPGTYYYTMFIDGKQIDTKKMVLTR